MNKTLPVDPETERLAKNIAEVTGKPLPVVVREAIAAKAEADGIGGQGHPRRKKLNFAKLNAILERAAERPVRDARTADEILGYNAYGLPE
jgi:antitoxin VapB